MLCINFQSQDHRFFVIPILEYDKGSTLLVIFKSGTKDFFFRFLTFLQSSSLVEGNPKSTHHEHALLEGESTSPVKAPEKQIHTQIFGPQRTL